MVDGARSGERAANALGCVVGGCAGLAGFVLGVLFVLLAFGPSLLREEWPEILEEDVNGDILGRVTIGEAELAWTRRIQVRDVRVYDPDGALVARFDASFEPLFFWVGREHLEFGAIEVHLHEARIAIDEHGESNLARAFTLTESALRLRDLVDSWVDRPEVELSSLALELDLAADAVSVARAPGAEPSASVSLADVAARVALSDAGALSGRVRARLAGEPHGSLAVDAEVADAIESLRSGRLFDGTLGVDLEQAPSALAGDWLGWSPAAVESLGERLTLHLLVENEERVGRGRTHPPFTLSADWGPLDRDESTRRGHLALRGGLTDERFESTPAASGRTALELSWLVPASWSTTFELEPPEPLLEERSLRLAPSGETEGESRVRLEASRLDLPWRPLAAALRAGARPGRDAVADARVAIDLELGDWTVAGRVGDAAVERERTLRGLRAHLESIERPGRRELVLRIASDEALDAELRIDDLRAFGGASDAPAAGTVVAHRLEPELLATILPPGVDARLAPVGGGPGGRPADGGGPSELVRLELREGAFLAEEALAEEAGRTTVPPARFAGSFRLGAPALVLAWRDGIAAGEERLEDLSIDLDLDDEEAGALELVLAATVRDEDGAPRAWSVHLDREPTRMPEPDEPAHELEVDADLGGFPVALLELWLERPGVLRSVLGARADLLIEKLELAGGRGSLYHAELRAEDTTLSVEGTIDGTSLVLDRTNDVTLTLGAERRALPPWLERLLPLWEDLELLGGPNEPRVLVRQGRLPLRGEGSPLAFGVIDLRLGSVRYVPWRALGRALAEPPSGEPVTHDDFELRLESAEGTLRMRSAELRDGDRARHFSGHYDPLERTLADLYTDVRLAALREGVNTKIDELRGLLAPDVVIPIVFQGPVEDPRVRISADVLASLRDRILGELLERGLGKDG